MVEAVMVGIMRHRRTKGTETDRPNLKPHIPSLYSTHAPQPPPLAVRLKRLVRRRAEKCDGEASFAKMVLPFSIPLIPFQLAIN
jgi:hypothetical protein